MIRSQKCAIHICEYVICEGLDQPVWLGPSLFDSGLGWWGGGGGGGVSGGRVIPIYGIVRMCVPNGSLFQRCQVYDWPPNKKYTNDPIFLDSYVKGTIFLTSWYMHIFFAQKFFEAACSLGIQWIDCDICLTISNKKSKGSISTGHYFGWSSVWMGPQGPVVQN